MIRAVDWSMVLLIRLRSWIWYRQDLEIADMWSVKERLESNMTPRLWADLAGESVTLSESDNIGWSSLESCLGWPMRRNSVLSGLSERKLADIQSFIEEIVPSRWVILEERQLGEKDM